MVRRAALRRKTGARPRRAVAASVGSRTTPAPRRGCATTVGREHRAPRSRRVGSRTAWPSSRGARRLRSHA